MTDSAQSRHSISDAKRIVVKIGSALLVDSERGTVHRNWLEALADDLVRLHKRGQQVILVSSGAIAVGRRYLKLGSGKLRLDEKQAAAAAGMVRLSQAYQDVLSHHDLTVAQVLLTMEDSENRRRYINARNTIETLLRLGAVPVINENDTVATSEIRFGDNDRLAARVAAMTSSDLLVLLSDIDGLYDGDPKNNPDARLVPEVRGSITPEIESMAGLEATEHGSGGMQTKLMAAKICLGAGTKMLIADGKVTNPLKAIEEGANATWFIPTVEPKTARKHWISGTLKPGGTIILDDGAVSALRSGKSLLPAGVTDVQGDFQRGEAVIVKTSSGSEIARGLCAYSSQEARRIMGYKTGEIESLLGYRGRDEMIHRDDLVVG